MNQTLPTIVNSKMKVVNPSQRHQIGSMLGARAHDILINGILKVFFVTFVCHNKPFLITQLPPKNFEEQTIPSLAGSTDLNRTYERT